MRFSTPLLLLGSSLLISTASWASQPDPRPQPNAWYQGQADEQAEAHRRDVAKREAYWEAQRQLSKARADEQTQPARYSNDH